MVTISFPGIGIDNFMVNKVAFSIGNLEVRWYGIIITLGIILVVAYCAYRAKQEQISVDDLLDMAIFTIIFAIIGARLYYVLTSLSEYDSFYEVIAIWEGGLAIYGGIIAGAITIYVVCRIKKISFAKAFDMVAPAVMIGQILGRWGNFFNGEAYGREIAENSIFYFIRMGLIPNIESASKMHYFHPTFLYESLWNLVGFIIINALYKKKKFDGQICLMYISWYGFGRMLIEGLRTDSLYVGAFRISQVIGFLCFVVGSVLLIYNLVKARRTTLTSFDYAPVYPNFSHTAPKVSSDETVSPISDGDGENTQSKSDGGETDGDEKEEETNEEAFKRYRIIRSSDDKNEEIDEKLKNLFGTEEEDNDGNNDGDNN